MKKYFKTLICFFGFLSLTSFQTINFNSNKPQLMVFVKGWQQEKEIYYLHLKVRLQNNSKDTLTYQSMSCSWEDLYSIKPDALKVYKDPYCFSNFPVRVKIAPFDHHDEVIKIKYKTGVKLNNLNCQIGFNLVEMKPNDNIFEMPREINQSKNVIWSNPITVK